MRLRGGKKRRSVRAGTNQAKDSDGAPGSGDARRAKCQVATQYCGPSNGPAEIGAMTRAVSKGITCRQRWYKHASNSGGKIFTTCAEGLKLAPSITEQASVQFRCPSEQPPRQVCGISPVASNAQCSDAESHRVRMNSERNGSRRRTWIGKHPGFLVDVKPDELGHILKNLLGLMTLEKLAFPPVVAAEPPKSTVLVPALTV